MDTKERFELAFEKSKTLKERPSNEVLLKLYGLYKQAAEGNISGDRPGGFDFKAIAKYDAWASYRNMSQEEAMNAYVDFVESLFN